MIKHEPLSGEPLAVKMDNPSIWSLHMMCVCVCARACMCVLSPCSCVQLLAALLITVHQAPLSMEFSRQEYWSGLSWPPPGDLPMPSSRGSDPGIESTSLRSPTLGGVFFTTSATWEAVRSA